MIKYSPIQPENSLEVSSGFLKAQGFNNPVIAKELLKISAGDYITREIISRVVLARMARPELERLCDLNQLFYTLGEPQDAADFGSYMVPVTIYAPRV